MNDATNDADVLYLVTKVDSRLFKRVVSRLREIEEKGGAAHIEIHLHAKGTKDSSGIGALILKVRLDLDEEFGHRRLTPPTCRR